MKKIRVSLALAFLLALASSSALAQKHSAAQADGRTYRAAVVRNYQAKGLSTDIRVHYVRDSASGKSAQVLAETRASGKVRSRNVEKATNTARQTPTGLLSQKAAQAKANQVLRRQNGQYSGSTANGLSRSGQSYEFTSKTDRRPGTADKAFVNAQTGKLRHFVQGR